MNPKIEITKKVAEILGLSLDNKSIKKLIQTWWQNPRNKPTGGLHLTEQGFNSLKQADIKVHKIKLETPIIFYSNQLVIWLDRFIDSPWFLCRNEIFVFGDKTAVQLILFSGNIERFVNAKAESLKSH